MTTSSNNHVNPGVGYQAKGLLIYTNSQRRCNSSSSSNSGIALLGWKDAPQPWNEKTCKKWIPWCYILRHWPKTRQEKLMKGYYAPLRFCEHDAYKAELTRMWKTLSKNEEATKRKRCMIPYWLGAMVYAKVFLDRKVDWNLVDKKHKNSKLIQNYSEDT